MRAVLAAAFVASGVAAAVDATLDAGDYYALLQTQAYVADEPAPVCLHSDIQQAIGHMHGACVPKLSAAINKNAPLTDQHRCFCYLQVNRSIAMGLNCRTMAAKTKTLVQEYNECETGSHQYSEAHGTCQITRLTPFINSMTHDCQEDLYEAVENNSPLENERRCSCYLQIDKQEALSVNCKSMPDKEFTVAQEYQNCLDAQEESAI
jgi:hypothetical protein